MTKRKMSVPSKQSLRDSLLIAKAAARRAEEANSRLVLLNQQLRACLTVALDIPSFINRQSGKQESA